MEKISTLGVAICVRVYGDWTSPCLTGWKPYALAFGMQPIQQFAAVPGKNSTDLAMAIDAMDLLYSGAFDGFCLVSSDSDFASLALRIRRSGLTVFGFGNGTSLSSLQAACDLFFPFSSLGEGSVGSSAVATEPAVAPKAKAAVVSAPQVVKPLVATAPKVKTGVGSVPPAVAKAKSVPKPAPKVKVKAKPAVTVPPVVKNTEDMALIDLLTLAIMTARDETGWAALTRLGSVLRQHDPGFSPARYGHGSLSKLILRVNRFDVDDSIKSSTKVRLRTKDVVA